jgi:RNA polymerase sigma factor (TIGR02999 family)
MSSQAVEITKMLGEIRDGSREASNQLMDAVYTDLRRMAQRLFAHERPDHTLQPTAVVHEAWMRIFSGADVPWQNRVHFYAVAARQMRRVLTDHGREFHARKRGSGLKVALDEIFNPFPVAAVEFEEVNELLERLERIDPNAANVVEMKFFSGMTDREVAAEMQCSPSTVRRHWNFAKAWLLRQMTGSTVIEES